MLQTTPHPEPLTKGGRTPLQVRTVGVGSEDIGSDDRSQGRQLHLPPLTPETSTVSWSCNRRFSGPRGETGSEAIETRLWVISGGVLSVLGRVVPRRGEEFRTFPTGTLGSEMGPFFGFLSPRPWSPNSDGRVNRSPGHYPERSVLAKEDPGG